MHCNTTATERLELASALRRHGYPLASDPIMRVLGLLVEAMDVAARVQIVDSLFVSLFVAQHTASDSTHRRTTIARMRTYLSGGDGSVMTLLPLHAASHWSLLILCLPHHRWYYVDSCDTVHAEHLKTVLRAIRTLAMPSLDDHTFIHVQQAPHQLADWECGHYVMLYAQQFLRTLRDEGCMAGTSDYDTYRTAMHRTIAGCDDGERLAFITAIVDYLEGRQGTPDRFI